MAYTPINWQTGDTITAERLNRMDRGWSVGSTQLFSETVTTAGQDGMYSAALTYSQLINADTITVTFDGTEYTCPRIDAFDQYFYGGFSEQGPVFTEYPFTISSFNISNTVYTETASEHTVSVTATSMQVSSDFSSAVDAASTIDATMVPFRCIPGVTTYAEMRAAADAGRLLYFYAGSNNFHLVIRFNNEVSETAVTAYPEGVVDIETYGFNSNMVFTTFFY